MKWIKIILLVLLGSGFLGHPCQSQPLPPPENAGEEGPMGGPAPVDTGLALALGLYAFYAVRRLIILRKEQTEEPRL